MNSNNNNIIIKSKLQNISDTHHIFSQIGKQHQQNKNNNDNQCNLQGLIFIMTINSS